MTFGSFEHLFYFYFIFSTLNFVLLSNPITNKLYS